MYEATALPPVQSVPDIDAFSPGRVYQLLAPWRGGKGSVFAHNGQLTEAYNASPIAIDDILIHPTTDYEGQLNLVINPTLIGQSIPLRTENIESERNNGESTSYILTEEQKAERDRPSLVRRIGQAGVSGTGVAYPTYELAQLAPWQPAAMLGIVAAAALYGAGKLVGRNRGKTRAIESLHAFGDWADNPDNGAICFAREKFNVPAASRRDWQQTEVFPITCERVARVSRWLYNRRDPDPAFLFQDRALSVIDQDTNQVAIQPGKLVFSLLKIDAAPAELWNDEFGFGDKVRELAEMELKLLHDRLAVKQIMQRHDFTGHYASGEADVLVTLRTQIAAQSSALLDLGLAMAEHCVERDKKHQLDLQVEKTAKLISEVVDGTADVAHPLEHHLQVMYSVASEALASLELNQEQTLEIVHELGTYLKGTRKLLTDRNQMGQFYAGMRDKFADRIPSGLPEWEIVAARLPLVDC